MSDLMSELQSGSESKPGSFVPFHSAEARERFLARYAEQEADWPVAFESRFLATDYGETFVRISGPAEGAPLVLLPGGLSSSLVWRRLIEPLSTHSAPTRWTLSTMSAAASPRVP